MAHSILFMSAHPSLGSRISGVDPHCRLCSRLLHGPETQPTRLGLHPVYLLQSALRRDAKALAVGASARAPSSSRRRQPSQPTAPPPPQSLQHLAHQQPERGGPPPPFLADLDKLTALVPTISLDDILSGKPLPPDAFSSPTSTDNGAHPDPANSSFPNQARQQPAAGTAAPPPLRRRAVRPWESAPPPPPPPSRATPSTAPAYSPTQQTPTRRTAAPSSSNSQSQAASATLSAGAATAASDALLPRPPPPQRQLFSSRHSSQPQSYGRVRVGASQALAEPAAAAAAATTAAAGFRPAGVPALVSGGAGAVAGGVASGAIEGQLPAAAAAGPAGSAAALAAALGLRRQCSAGSGELQGNTDIPGVSTTPGGGPGMAPGGAPGTAPGGGLSTTSSGGLLPQLSAQPAAAVATPTELAVRSTRAPRAQRVHSREWIEARQAVEVAAAEAAAVAASRREYDVYDELITVDWRPDPALGSSTGGSPRAPAAPPRPMAPSNSLQWAPAPWAQDVSAVSEPRGLLVVPEAQLRSALEAASIDQRLGGGVGAGLLQRGAGATAAVTAAAASLMSPEDLPDVVDSRTWQLHAAVQFQDLYDADWHGCLFDFLFELWPEVGRAHVAVGGAAAVRQQQQRLLVTDADLVALVAAESGAPLPPPPPPSRRERAARLIDAAYRFAAACSKSPDFAVRSALVVSVLDCLDDHDTLIEQLATRLPASVVLRLLVPLVPQFQPEWVVEDWMAAVRVAYPDFNPNTSVPEPWRALIARLKAAQAVHHGTSLAVLHSVLHFDEGPGAGRMGAQRRQHTHTRTDSAGSGGSAAAWSTPPSHAGRTDASMPQPVDEPSAEAAVAAAAAGPRGAGASMQPGSDGIGGAEESSGKGRGRMRGGGRGQAASGASHVQEASDGGDGAEAVFRDAGGRQQQEQQAQEGRGRGRGRRVAGERVQASANEEAGAGTVADRRAVSRPSAGRVGGRKGTERRRDVQKGGPGEPTGQEGSVREDTAGIEAGPQPQPQPQRRRRAPRSRKAQVEAAAELDGECVGPAKTDAREGPLASGVCSPEGQAVSGRRRGSGRAKRQAAAGLP